MRWPNLKLSAKKPRKTSKNKPVSTPFLLVGLGNPGPAYERTRHNVGFDFVERLAQEASLRWESPWFRAVQIARSPSLVLAKPQTFMNRSGAVFPYLLSRFRVPRNKICVVVDNMDLPVGEFRMKRRGGPAGHNGLRSVGRALQSNDYARLYIGVGRPAGGSDAVEHVLGRFSDHDRERVDAALMRVVPVFLDNQRDITMEQRVSLVNEHRYPPNSSAIG